ncbi:PQQ-dependent sugar dehydrogenase [Exiguobacterium aurantiacum]|uniref:PQQ-dependent sugar dehydrogenase n=1 Tax=Exiguobacterium aurantiacum TaxID=33987 RepID=A0ABY5FLE6_9BACL|nr:PQQ-dependent sugar dehydrogenase [Exiguobacterium aurantiacum]UTT42371.1 PQQ-dependent sugar dehydrogenase [Exiguobacterium aurantiacum]
MKRWILMLSLIVLAGCASESEDASTPDETPVEEAAEQEQAPTEEAPSDEAPSETDEPLVIGANESVVEQLEAPWSIAQTDDGWLISERGGTIAVIDADGNLDRQSVILEEDVLEIGEGGLLGLALTTDFATSRQVYAYHTYGTPGDVRNRVVELTWDGDQFEETAVVLDEIPGAQFHNGGRLLLDGDVLWVTTGDALVPELAQDETSIAGKVLRVPLSGGGEPDDWIYSSGHRNPQGLTKIEDTLYASEHGASGHDEVNILEQGNNYGWPLIEANEKQEGLETPWFEVGETSWAPSGIAADDRYVYMATLRGNRLVAIDRETKEVTPLVEDRGRIRDVWLGDGELYFITNNTDGRGNPSNEDDQLYRLTIK